MVVYADKQFSGCGNLVLVHHAGHWMTASSHMHGTLLHRRQEVRRDESIGTVGKAGSVDSSRLHFEIRRGTEALNPELYLARQAS